MKTLVSFFFLLVKILLLCFGFLKYISMRVEEREDQGKQTSFLFLIYITDKEDGKCIFKYENEIVKRSKKSSIYLSQPVFLCLSKLEKEKVTVCVSISVEFVGTLWVSMKMHHAPIYLVANQHCFSNGERKGFCFTG